MESEWVAALHLALVEPSASTPAITNIDKGEAWGALDTLSIAANDALENSYQLTRQRLAHVWTRLRVLQKLIVAREQAYDSYQAASQAMQARMVQHAAVQKICLDIGGQRICTTRAFIETNFPTSFFNTLIHWPLPATAQGIYVVQRAYTQATEEMWVWMRTARCHLSKMTMVMQTLLAEELDFYQIPFPSDFYLCQGRRQRDMYTPHRLNLSNNACCGLVMLPSTADTPFTILIIATPHSLELYPLNNTGHQPFHQPHRSMNMCCEEGAEVQAIAVMPSNGDVCVLTCHRHTRQGTLTVWHLHQTQHIKKCWLLQPQPYPVAVCVGTSVIAVFGETLSVYIYSVHTGTLLSTFQTVQTWGLIIPICPCILAISRSDDIYVVSQCDTIQVYHPHQSPTPICYSREVARENWTVVGAIGIVVSATEVFVVTERGTVQVMNFKGVALRSFSLQGMGMGMLRHKYLAVADTSERLWMCGNRVVEYIEVYQ